MHLYAKKYIPQSVINSPFSADNYDLKINQTPLIILHGLFGSHRNWHAIARQLSKTRKVYALDMRNHGQSPHSQHMNYPLMAEDIRLFIEQQIQPSGTTSVDIIAHSMGGKAAMWFALLYPNKIAKLVIIDIAPVTYSHNFSEVFNAFQAVPLAHLTSREQAESYLTPWISSQDLRQFLLQNLQCKQGSYIWRLNLNAIQHAITEITAFPTIENITPFTRKVLFIGGHQSDYLTIENRQITRKLFPKASFSMIKSAGHWLHVEQPELLIQLIQHYLLIK
jgi:pimeloyl-ACP methyl ester carboxylesterase